MPNVEIYTRDYCGFCTLAKHTLSKHGLAFKEYNASQNKDYRAEMIQRSGRTTFPQVFIDNRHIGGSDDLRAFANSGGLDAVVNNA